MAGTRSSARAPKPESSEELTATSKMRGAARSFKSMTVAKSPVALKRVTKPSARSTRSKRSDIPLPPPVDEETPDNDQSIELNEQDAKTPRKSRSAVKPVKVAATKGRATRGRGKTAVEEILDDIVVVSPFGNITGNAEHLKKSTRSAKSVTPAPVIIVNNGGDTLEIPEENARAIGRTLRETRGKSANPTGVTKSLISRRSDRRPTRKGRPSGSSSSKDEPEPPQQEPVKKSRATRTTKNIEVESHPIQVINLEEQLQKREPDKKIRTTRGKKTVDPDPHPQIEEVPQEKQDLVKKTRSSRGKVTFESELLLDPMDRIKEEEEPTKAPRATRGRSERLSIVIEPQPEVMVATLKKVQEAVKKTRVTRGKKLVVSEQQKQLEIPVVHEKMPKQQEPVKARVTRGKNVDPEPQQQPEPEPIKKTRSTRAKKIIEPKADPELIASSEVVSLEQEPANSRDTRGRKVAEPETEQSIQEQEPVRKTRTKRVNQSTESELELEKPSLQTKGRQTRPTRGKKAVDAQEVLEMAPSQIGRPIKKGRRTSSKTVELPPSQPSTPKTPSKKTPGKTPRSVKNITEMELDNECDTVHVKTPIGFRIPSPTGDSITVAQNDIAMELDDRFSPEPVGTIAVRDDKNMSSMALSSPFTGNPAADQYTPIPSNLHFHALRNSPPTIADNQAAENIDAAIQQEGALDQDDISAEVVASEPMEDDIVLMSPLQSAPQVDTDVEKPEMGTGKDDAQTQIIDVDPAINQGVQPNETPQRQQSALARDPIMGTPVSGFTPLGAPVTPSFGFGSPIVHDSFPNSPVLPSSVGSSRAQSPVKSPSRIPNTPIKVFSPATGVTPTSVKSVMASPSKSSIMDDAQQFTQLSPATSKTVAGSAKSPVKQSPQPSPIADAHSSPLDLYGMGMPSSPPKRSQDQVSSDHYDVPSAVDLSTGKSRESILGSRGELPSPSLNPAAIPAGKSKSPGFSPLKQKHQIPHLESKDETSKLGMNVTSSPVRRTRQSALFDDDEPSRIGIHGMDIPPSPVKRSPKAPSENGSPVNCPPAAAGSTPAGYDDANVQMSPPKKMASPDIRNESPTRRSPSERPAGYDSLFDDTYSLSPVQINPHKQMLEDFADELPVPRTSGATSPRKQTPEPLLDVPLPVNPDPVKFTSFQEPLLDGNDKESLSLTPAMHPVASLNISSPAERSPSKRPAGYDSLFDDTYSLTPVRVSPPKQMLLNIDETKSPVRPTLKPVSLVASPSNMARNLVSDIPSLVKESPQKTTLDEAHIPQNEDKPSTTQQMLKIAPSPVEQSSKSYQGTPPPDRPSPPKNAELPRPAGYDSLFDETYSLSPVHVTPQKRMLDEIDEASGFGRITHSSPIKHSPKVASVLADDEPSRLGLRGMNIPSSPATVLPVTIPQTAPQSSPSKRLLPSSPIHRSSSFPPEEIGSVGFDSFDDKACSLSPVRLTPHKTTSVLEDAGKESTKIGLHNAPLLQSSPVKQSPIHQSSTPAPPANDEGSRLGLNSMDFSLIEPSSGPTPRGEKSGFVRSTPIRQSSGLFSDDGSPSIPMSTKPTPSYSGGLSVEEPSRYGLHGMAIQSSPIKQPLRTDGVSSRPETDIPSSPPTAGLAEYGGMLPDDIDDAADDQNIEDEFEATPLDDLVEPHGSSNPPDVSVFSTDLTPTANSPESKMLTSAVKESEIARSRAVTSGLKQPNNYASQSSPTKLLAKRASSPCPIERPPNPTPTKALARNNELPVLASSPPMTPARVSRDIDNGSSSPFQENVSPGTPGSALRVRSFSLPPSRSPKRRLSYIEVPQAGEGGPATPPAQRLKENIEVAPDSVSRRRYGRRASAELYSMANEPLMEQLKALARGYLVRKRIGTIEPGLPISEDEPQKEEEVKSFGILDSFIRKHEEKAKFVPREFPPHPAPVSRIPKLGAAFRSSPSPSPCSPSSSISSVPSSPEQSLKRKAEDTPSPVL
ncbi:hypothetical protein BDD12DRAFT_392467 [Trichophaea hybrida]|nr:hypothetical protein BDD12DRAFT_392467 [Trichophaea hybrida]